MLAATLDTGCCEITIFDEETLEPRTKLLGHNPHAVKSLCFNATSTLLASADRGGFLRLWDTTNFQQVVCIEESNKMWIYHMNFAHISELLLHDSWDGVDCVGIKLRSPEHEWDHVVWSLPGYEKAVFNQDDTRVIAVESSAAYVCTINTNSGDVLSRNKAGINGLGFVTHCRVNNAFVFTDRDGGRLNWWQLSSADHGLSERFQRIHVTPNASGSVIFGIAFSPDGRKLAACERSHNSIGIYDVVSKTLIQYLLLGDFAAYSVGFGPGGHNVIAAGIGGIGVYCVETGAILFRVVSGFGYDVPVGMFSNNNVVILL
jgi:DNA-binding beta-propeller fold protein YncE